MGQSSNRRWAALLVCALVAGCEAADLTSQTTAKLEVVVLAAASTTDAVEEIAHFFEQSREVDVTISAGPSSGLAQQIIAGAPADIFVSASETWGAAVQEKGLAAELRPLLSNQLVLVAPRGNPAQISSPDDLKSESVERVALAGEHVPAGVYADQALQSLGLQEALVESGKIVRGHDVRIALGYVEQGEAEAGIVYSTDAKVSDRVEVVYTFPADTHDAIRYPALLLKQQQPNPAAAEFFEFLFSEQADDVFRKYGFARPEGRSTPGGGSR